MDDRIKLAEAIGWKLVDGVWHGKGSTWDSLMFDPENNANDDYAVLEWARQSAANECGLLPSGKPRWSSSDKWWPFYETLNAKPHRAEMYKIGDYARAALKVIGETK